MNSKNHLHRVQFRTLSYHRRHKKVVLQGENVIVQCGAAIPRWFWIEPSPENLEEPLRGGWDRRILMDFANAQNTTPAILEFTQHYGPITADLVLHHHDRNSNSHRDTVFSVQDWRDRQDEFRKTWNSISPASRRRVSLAPGGMLEVTAAERFSWHWNELVYETADLYRLLLLELHSFPQHRVWKCARQGCTTPYFIREHGNERYCSQPCQDEAHRAVKLRSWHRHKKHWRATAQA